MVSDSPENATAEPVAATPTTIPWLAHACGLAIVIAAALPITPDGRSFVALLIAEFQRGLLQGVLMLSGFGSPFLFGLAVLGVAWPRLHDAARDVLRGPIGLMHGQLLLVAFVVWRHGQAVAALPLLGFAVVGAVVYVRSGMAAPGGKRLTALATMRWGAIVVAGVAAWCRLQALAGVSLGRAVDVVLAASLVLAIVTRPRAR